MGLEINKWEIFPFQLRHQGPEWKTFWPHFLPFNDLPGPWNPSRSTGRTQKCCVGYQEHQNRSAVARFSLFGPILAFPRSKAILTFQELKRATVVRFWCSLYPTQHFWVRSACLDKFQGPGRSFRGEKWGRKSKSGRFSLLRCDNRPQMKNFPVSFFTT